MEFPLMLLRAGLAFEWDGTWYDATVANDHGELDAALADGWSLGKPEETPTKRKPGRPAKAEGMTNG